MFFFSVYGPQLFFAVLVYFRAPLVFCILILFFCGVHGLSVLRVIALLKVKNCHAQQVGPGTLFGKFFWNNRCLIKRNNPDKIGLNLSNQGSKFKLTMMCRQVMEGYSCMWTLWMV